MFRKPGNVVNSNPNDFENSFECIPDKFSSCWDVLISLLALLLKLAFKNKMHNTIKLETQDQRFHQSTQRLATATTTIVH